MATPPNINKVRRYEQWRTGQLDRLYNKPCCSSNGDYIDGWYNPNQHIPDFLTIGEVATLKRHFDSAYATWLKELNEQKIVN